MVEPAHALGNDVIARNRSFYESLWSAARLHQPTRFNTWPLVASLLPTSPRRLELGPGLRPRLPIADTCFVDISPSAGQQLHARGGLALTGHIGALPFRNQTFDLVCACDVIEHVEDDGAVFREMSRVLKDDGVLVIAVPMHSGMWTAFDTWVGHARRYAPAELRAVIGDHHFTLERSAIYGMQPANDRWLRWGMWYMTHLRRWALFWYNWVGMPIATMFQKPLQLADGLIERPDAAELLLVCRRQRRT